MRLWRPSRSLSSVGETLRESLFFLRSPNLSSSSQISSPILLHSSESHRFSASSISEDEKYGFRRSEMHRSNLAGTVAAYERHVFLCYRTHEVWPSRVEDSDADLLPNLLSSAIKSRKNEISVKTKLTMCEAGEGAENSDGDVLIFPEMLKYSRDPRCGVCGTAIITKLKEEIELRGLKNQIHVHACSHIGGHKYAGNVIVYSPDSDGRIMGHWYGYVTPDDVPELLDKHIGKGELIERLWRGQMGRSKDEEGKKVGEDKRPNAEVSKGTENKPC